MSKPLIIIPCTDRKRNPANGGLEASQLNRGTVQEVAKAWLDKVQSAAIKSPANKTYCGRSFSETLKSSQKVNANLTIISAGLGIVEQSHLIPSYGLTVADRKRDSIRSKVSTENWSPDIWWQTLKMQKASGFDLQQTLETYNPSIILMYLSQQYARMLKTELQEIDILLRKKIRIFGLGLENVLSPELRGNIMPYDLRLNGPDSTNKGTITDFGPRCIAHFCDNFLKNNYQFKTLDWHKAQISKSLENMRCPEKLSRTVITNDQVTEFILNNWEKIGGTSSKMLRHLRDRGFACEQSRFADLFRQTASNRAKQGELGL